MYIRIFIYKYIYWYNRDQNLPNIRRHIFLSRHAPTACRHGSTMRHHTPAMCPRWYVSTIYIICLWYTMRPPCARHGAYMVYIYGTSCARHGMYMLSIWYVNVTPCARHAPAIRPPWYVYVYTVFVCYAMVCIWYVYIIYIVCICYAIRPPCALAGSRTPLSFFRHFI